MGEGKDENEWAYERLSDSSTGSAAMVCAPTSVMPMFCERLRVRSSSSKLIVSRPRSVTPPPQAWVKERRGGVRASEMGWRMREGTGKARARAGWPRRGRSR